MYVLEYTCEHCGLSETFRATKISEVSQMVAYWSVSHEPQCGKTVDTQALRARAARMGGDDDNEYMVSGRDIRILCDVYDAEGLLKRRFERIRAVTEEFGLPEYAMNRIRHILDDTGWGKTE